MSSLVFLGYSVVLFIISYGIGFLLVASVLGVFFSSLASFPITDPGWLATYTKEQTTLKLLIPLMPTIGIFIFFIKVLMASSVRGRD